MAEEAVSADASNLKVVRDPNFCRIAADHGFVTAAGHNLVELALLADSQSLDALKFGPGTDVHLVGETSAVELVRLRMTFTSALVMVGNILGSALNQGVVKIENIEAMVENLKKMAAPESGTP